MNNNGLFHTDEDGIRLSRDLWDLEIRSQPTDESFPILFKTSQSQIPPPIPMPDDSSRSYFQDEEEDKIDTKFRPSMGTFTSMSL